MTPASIEEAAFKGLRFLRARQSEDGFWSEWSLPPGESRIWTTAYVGYRLASLRKMGELTWLPLRSASRWLLAEEFPGGGWGYGVGLGADADSTALAILFLSSQGLAPEDRCYQRLLEFQCANGGFATFMPPHGFGAWTKPHPEVTGTAVAALITRYGPRAPCVVRGIEWLRSNTAPDGLWNSYWWESRLYSIESNLAALCAADVGIEAHSMLRALRKVPARNCFEHSLLIMSVAHLENIGEKLADDATISELVSAQEQDGAWPSAALLRLTTRDCEEPWKREQAGPLFLDRNRVFTTATALAALARARVRRTIG
jgi:hypothetical protein